QLRAELQRFQSERGSRRLLLEARPVLEMIIARWREIPGESRRELFDGFAERVLVSKVDLVTRRLTVCWRDGTETTECIKNRQQYFSWSQDELERLGQMVENHASQVELLRAFPGVSWRGIRERYAYHFGRGKWRGVYKGKVRYGGKTRWQDTEEYRLQSLMTQPPASAVSSYP